MTRFQLLLGTLLWTCVLIAAGWMLLFDKKPSDSSAGSLPSPSGMTAPEGSVVVSADTGSVRLSFPSRELPEFEFPECMGGTVSRDGLKGHPWIASFVFTRCVTTCPMITKEMMTLHRLVGKTSPEVKFVTFSVDSSYDTAEVLKSYSEIYSADHERWKFVTGDEQRIHDLIREGFTLAVKPNLGEDRKPGFEVAHTNRVVLVNEDSIPVATFLATSPEDMVKLRRILEKKDDFPLPGPELKRDSLNGAVPEGAAPAVNLQLKKSRPADQQTPDSNSAIKIEPADGEPADGASEAVSPAAEPPAGDRELKSSLLRIQNDDRRRFARHKPDLHKIDVHKAILCSMQTDTGAETRSVRNERIDQRLPSWAAVLPLLNAGLNATCTVFLVCGYAAIRLGKRSLHRNLMVTAFVFSAVFLASYLTYHYALGRYTGERGRQFIGSDIAATVYKCILWPHVILAVFVPVLALRVFLHAFRGHWDKHRSLARITLPIWLFVSVTGVIIYWMLYRW